MAVRYAERIGDVTYEVRTAGRSVRLYTNAAFHSQYHPDHIFTGAVWDLLSLPSLCMKEPPRSILVLGVAGGTVIHQLQRLHDLEHATGIELDPVHIRLAREYFALDYDNTTLIEADAIDWVERDRNTYDYIVDDVFLHGEVDPARPFHAGRDWFRQLHSRLNPGGVIVQNHIGATEAYRAARQYRAGAVIGFETDCYENRVLAWYGRLPYRQLRARLDKSLSAMPRSETSRLRHHCQQVSA